MNIPEIYELLHGGLPGHRPVEAVRYIVPKTHAWPADKERTPVLDHEQQMVLASDYDALLRRRQHVPHLNAADLLPPVSCPLLIEVNGDLVRAERTGLIANRADDMEYRLAGGTCIHGRFRWTYP